MAVAEAAAKSRMQYRGLRGWLDRQLRAKFPKLFPAN